jgi:hypothetical protein
MSKLYAAIKNNKVVNIINFEDTEDTEELKSLIIERSDFDELVLSVPHLVLGSSWDGTNFIYPLEEIEK